MSQIFKLRTNICKQRIEQNSINCCTTSKAHFASRLFTYNCSSQLHENKQKIYIAYWTSWHNSIFVKN